MARDSFRNPPQQASRENTPVSFEEQAEKVALTHRVQQLESEVRTRAVSVGQSRSVGGFSTGQAPSYVWWCHPTTSQPPVLA